MNAQRTTRETGGALASAVVMAALLALHGPEALAQPPPLRPPGGPPPSGPWNNDVLVYRVPTNGEPRKLGVIERAGVPTVTRLKDGRLLAAFQHFPANDREHFDKVAVSFSTDEGHTWSDPQPVKFSGLPAGMMRPFDPTLVPLPDGRVRLYFTGNYARTLRESVPAIHSAISTDGVDYTYEPGGRFAVEGRPVIDCAVVLHDGVFNLYAPDPGAAGPRGQLGTDAPPASRPRDGVGFHASSTNGLDFTRQEDVRIEGRRRWLGNAQSDGAGITFFGTDDSGPARPGGRAHGGVWLATSTNGHDWTGVNTISGITGADPGAVRLRDESWLVLLTSPSVRHEPPPAPAGASSLRN